MAAVCWMERKNTRRSAGAQVLENGALDCVFRPTAVAGAAHGVTNARVRREFAVCRARR